jgi:hypothetical protein
LFPESVTELVDALVNLVERKAAREVAVELLVNAREIYVHVVPLAVLVRQVDSDKIPEVGELAVVFDRVAVRVVVAACEHACVRI